MYCTRFRFIFTLLLFLCVRYVQSQNNTVAYWEPEVALNYKVTPLLKQNFLYRIEIIPITITNLS